MVKAKLSESSSGKANKPKKGWNYHKISWCQWQCSGSSQIFNLYNLNDSHKFLSLYSAGWNGRSAELIIYDTENKKEQVKILDTKSVLDESTSITQLPNGELFCYGSYCDGITMIIDRGYQVSILPSGWVCRHSSALYFDSNVYCFGGKNKDNKFLTLSRKFDLKNKSWFNLARLPKADSLCHSVIFNGNILISGYFSRNLWLYSIEIDSFSIIPYNFAYQKRKVLINVERLYLIEWFANGSIYESEDEYYWKPISNVNQNLLHCNQMYCLYNKEKIYISTGYQYYQFDLKNKVLLEIE